jgi:hypothetical protein
MVYIFYHQQDQLQHNHLLAKWFHGSLENKIDYLLIKFNVEYLKYLVIWMIPDARHFLLARVLWWGDVHYRRLKLAYLRESILSLRSTYDGRFNSDCIYLLRYASSDRWYRCRFLLRFEIHCDWYHSNRYFSNIMHAFASYRI